MPDFNLYSRRVPRVGWLGDSHGAVYASQDTALATYNLGRGVLAWLQEISKQAIYTDASLHNAVLGYRSDHAADLLLNAAAANTADIVIVSLGRNDVGQITTMTAQQLFDRYISAITKILETLLTAGKEVILIPPFTTALADAPSRDAYFRMIAWCKSLAFAGHRGLTVIDCSHVLVDYASATSAFKTEAVSAAQLTYDGTHLTLGAYYVAKELWNKVFQYRTSFPGFPVTNIMDVYSADNPRGNMLANPGLTGTGGTRTGTGGTSGAFSGDTPTSWDLQINLNGGNFTALTVAQTQGAVADGSGRTFWKAGISVSAPITSAGSALIDACSGIIMRQSFSSFANFAAGDILEARAAIDVDAANVKISAVELRLDATDSAGNKIAASLPYMGDDYPQDATELVMRTPPLRLVSVPTVLRWSVRTYPKPGSVSPVGGVRISAPSLRKIN